MILEKDRRVLQTTNGPLSGKSLTLRGSYRPQEHSCAIASDVVRKVVHEKQFIRTLKLEAGASIDGMESLLESLTEVLRGLKKLLGRAQVGIRNGNESHSFHFAPNERSSDMLPFQLHIHNWLLPRSTSRARSSYYSSYFAIFTIPQNLLYAGRERPLANKKLGVLVMNVL